MSKSTIDRLADALTCLLNDWRAYYEALHRRTSEGLLSQAELALSEYRKGRGETEVEPESPEEARPMAPRHRWGNFAISFDHSDPMRPDFYGGVDDYCLAIELLRVVAERDRLSHRLELINGERESLFAQTVELRTRERESLEVQARQAKRLEALEAERLELRAEAEGLEAQRDHYRVAVSKLQQRVSKLDAMLSREAVPERLWRAVAQWPCLDHGRIVTAAWNWFREMFGPAQASEDVQGEPEGAEEPLPERLEIWFNERGVPQVTPEGRRGWPSKEAARRGVFETQRRWNAWPELRALVAQHVMAGGGPEACSDLCQGLLAILDGKPEGGQP